MNKETTKRLRLIVEERQKLESLVSRESTEQRDMKKLLLGLGKFFDQVYLYFLSSKLNSYAVGELSTALEQRSLNQKIHFKTAKLGLRLLAEAIPEWCQINDEGEERFVVFANKRLKPSVLRSKVVELARQTLDKDKLVSITLHLQHQDDKDKIDALGALLEIFARDTNTGRYKAFSHLPLLAALITNAHVDNLAVLSPQTHTLSYECRWRSVMLLALLSIDPANKGQARQNPQLVQVLKANVQDGGFATYAIIALAEMFIEPDPQLIGVLCTYLHRVSDSNNPAQRALKLVYYKYAKNDKQCTSKQLYTFWRAVQSVWSILVVRSQCNSALRRLPIDMFKLTFQMLNGC